MLISNNSKVGVRQAPFPRRFSQCNSLFRIRGIRIAAIHLCALLGFVFVSQATWKWSEPLPQGNALVSLAISPSGTQIAVGDYGTVLRSQPGGSWEVVESFTGGRALASVCWSAGRFLAVGPAAGLWESADGLVWSSVDESILGMVLLAGSGNVLCLGTDRLWSSSGGVFQSKLLSAVGLDSFRAAVSSGGKFLAIRRDGTLASSADGLSWSSAQPAPGINFFTAAGGPAGFLCGGFSQNGTSYVSKLFRSADAQTWIETPLPAGSSNIFYLYEAAGGWLLDEFVSIGGGAYQRRSAGDPPKSFLHRFTGLAWQRLLDVPADLFPYASLAINQQDTLLAGDRGSLILIQSDASLKKLTSSVFDSSYLVPSSFTAAGVGDTIVAIDKYVRRAEFAKHYTTRNGSLWSKSATVPGTALTALSSAQGSIVGFSHFTSTSPRGFFRLSGADWVPIVPQAESGLDAISLDAYVISFASNADASSIVVLTRQETYDSGGSYSAIRGLYRGSNWSGFSPVALPDVRTEQPPADSVAESVQWDGSRFVMLLHPGRVYTSANGLDWSLLPALPQDSKEKLAVDYPGQKITPKNHAISVASDGNRIVARAAKLDSLGLRLQNLPSNEETIFVFELGRWWPVTASLPVSVERRRVYFDGSFFLAIGDGELLSSRNARSWNSHPLPATVVELVSSGTKRVAFTDSFAALTLDGTLDPGTPLGQPMLEPLLKNLDSSSQSYSIEVSSVGREWKVSGVPSWMTVSPSSGSGSATLSIVVSANSGKLPRGAILKVGSLIHLVGQEPPGPLPPLSFNSKAHTVTIPFSGAWNAALSPLFASFPKDASTGSGNVRVLLPSNPLPASRELVVNINGSNRTITQAGTPEAEIRAGSYSGLIGTLFENAPDFSLSSMESFEGSVSISLAKPSRASPHGSYSATASLYRGGLVHKLQARGSVNPDGTITGTWRSSGKTPLVASVNLSIRDDFASQKDISGNITLSGSPAAMGLFAAKHVFASGSNPLPAQHPGKFTFFLTTFGNLGVDADSAVGSASIQPNGSLRLAGTLADGSKFTTASSIWGAAGTDLASPLFIPAAKGASILAGLFVFDPSKQFSDWDGPWNAINNSTITQLTGALSRYVPPARGQPLLKWNSPAPFSLSSTQLNLVTGTASLPKPSVLSIALDSPLLKVSLRPNPATGLVTGSLNRGIPRSRPIPLLGAVNQKSAESIDGSKGSIMGFVPGIPGDTFSIIP